jgi:hypothetical protein
MCEEIAWETDMLYAPHVKPQSSRPFNPETGRWFQY